MTMLCAHNVLQVIRSMKSLQTNPPHLILAEFKLVLVLPHCLPQMPQSYRYDTIFWRYYHA